MLFFDRSQGDCAQRKKAGAKDVFTRQLFGTNQTHAVSDNLCRYTKCKEYVGVLRFGGFVVFSSCYFIYRKASRIPFRNTKIISR